MRTLLAACVLVGLAGSDGGAAVAHPVKVILARHGASAFTPGAPTATGTPDPALSEKGLEEAGRLAELAAAEGVTEIYTSPFRRARLTADVAGRRLGLAVRVVPDLAEWNLGDLMGRDWSISPYREQLAEAFAHTDRARPQGETFRQLHHRATRALEEILAQPTDRPRTILVVAHGVTNRALRGQAKGLTLPEALALESQPGNSAWIFSRTSSGNSDLVARSY